MKISDEDIKVSQHIYLYMKNGVPKTSYFNFFNILRYELVKISKGC